MMPPGQPTSPEDISSSSRACCRPVTENALAIGIDVFLGGEYLVKRLGPPQRLAEATRRPHTR